MCGGGKRAPNKDPAFKGTQTVSGSVCVKGDICVSSRGAGHCTSVTEASGREVAARPGAGSGPAPRGPQTPALGLARLPDFLLWQQREAFQLLFAMSFAVILKGRHAAALPGGDVPEQQPPPTQAWPLLLRVLKEKAASSKRTPLCARLEHRPHWSREPMGSRVWVIYAKAPQLPRIHHPK